ncbi:MAG: ABC transporter ATP-binding protein [Clostridiales Family XIII bacterium]|jgi:teichoic acid transport system ATP-binding protein|nr:ABC transporter ATP-binding protein [Clostridiales Family XIII bacterium]
MSSEKVVIRFSNVKKLYKLFPNDKKRLISVFFPKAVHYHSKWAVDDVSFEIHEGESVAIFGVNGAGKSTVLKMITGVAFPTEGWIDVNGRVSALLELTAGFDSELTGRENIYLKCQLMGMRDPEIEASEQSIIDFAEIGEYIDQPTRTYSSGMLARLGFAINVNTEPEIFIVDEALATGDSRFQEKCLARVREIIDKDNVTLLFVTHATDTAVKFCKRGLVMKDGKVTFDGPIEEAKALYEGGEY